MLRKKALAEVPAWSPVSYDILDEKQHTRKSAILSDLMVKADTP
jgi:hypothetical protein